MAINTQQKDSDMDLIIDVDVLTGLKDKRSKLETDIKLHEEKWTKESDLTRKFMKLRMKKFSVAGNGNGKE